MILYRQEIRFTDALHNSACLKTGFLFSFCWKAQTKCHNDSKQFEAFGGLTSVKMKILFKSLLILIRCCFRSTESTCSRCPPSDTWRIRSRRYLCFLCTETNSSKKWVLQNDLRIVMYFFFLTRICVSFRMFIRHRERYNDNVVNETVAILIFLCRLNSVATRRTPVYQCICTQCTHTFW